MRRLLRPLLLLAVVLSATALRADSLDPDLKRLIREAHKPKVRYGPARVGWNGPEVPMTPVVNPTYESLRVDSPAAMRQELKAVLVPQWQFLLAFLGMIIGLRILRNAKKEEPAHVDNVLAFPTPAPHEEAA